MRKDLRIMQLNIDHERISQEYSAVKERRIELAKTLYAEGWTIEELVKAMNTNRTFLKRAIPEAFESKEDFPPEFNLN